MNRKTKKFISIGTQSIFSIVYFGLLVYIIYFLASVATDRYTTEAHFTITKDETAQSTSAAELLGLGSNLGTADTQLAVGYIESVDLLLKAEEKFNMQQHYSDDSYDEWFRLEKQATLEERLKYYRKRITTKLDETTGMVRIKVESYDPNYSQKICRYILDKSELYINNLNKGIANERFKLVEDERDMAAKDLSDAKKEYSFAQSKFNVISKESEIESKYALLNQIDIRLTELKASLGTEAFGDNDKEKQIESLTNKYKETLASLTGPEKDEFNKKMLNLKDKEYEVGRAQEIFDNTLVMYNQTRIDSIAKSRFFSRVQEPYLPEEPLQPRRIYLSFTVAILGLLLFSILRIILKSILSH